MRKLFLLSFLVLAGCELRHDSPGAHDKKEEESVGRFPVEVITKTNVGRTSRFYDPEYGNVCYILDGYRAIDCVPANK